MSVFSPNTGKCGPEKTLYLDPFHAMILSHTLHFRGQLLASFLHFCFRFQTIYNKNDTFKACLPSACLYGSMSILITTEKENPQCSLKCSIEWLYFLNLNQITGVKCDTCHFMLKKKVAKAT